MATDVIAGWLRQTVNPDAAARKAGPANSLHPACAQNLVAMFGTNGPSRGPFCL